MMKEKHGVVALQSASTYKRETLTDQCSPLLEIYAPLSLQ